MALTNITKMANRYGLNIEFFDYENYAEGSDAVVAIEFANEVSLELTSEISWATGGQSHSNMIGFKDPTEGTLTLSTQVVTPQLLVLAAGGDPSKAETKASFANDKASAKPRYYVIKGKTLRVGEDGATYAETITAYKACVKPGYSATYNGSGDPQSLDIEFELGMDEVGKVVDIEILDDNTPTA